MKKLSLLFCSIIFFITACNADTKDMVPQMEEEFEPAQEEAQFIEEEENSFTMENKSPTTGLEFDGEYKPLLVVIENSSAARPQSGLIHADIVYEVMVEGRITRFLAVFNDKDVDVVGPVRSLRHYHLDIYKEWNTLLVHFGGSGFAQDIYNNDKSINRIDGIAPNSQFWRDDTRKAPHNAYINTEKCRETMDLQHEERVFSFTDRLEYKGDQYSEIIIPYQNNNNVNKYVYDKESDMNLRYINNEPHFDRESKEQIAVTNIIVQYAPHKSMNTSAGHIDIDLIGSGKMLYFTNGIWFEGTWTKEDKESRTVFIDYNGNEIMIMQGNTWIHVVPLDMEVEIARK